ncbi:Trm112 family protein [Ornithinimicrobium sediminis]|uniref:Trm112 family protein n=1 Tax=Ornithinimicrobium sediminis TaxID=2904603 RepID=UPI001E2BA0A7|nr:hypothetical protein [Ornithinimicrobium sediminis]MCE0486471.1 hypothetical protein [Ornithinimicrobium sediminis]
MSPTIPAWARELLRCPVGHHPLVDGTDDAGHPVMVCAEDCPGPGQRRSYPVTDGIPVLLVAESTVTGR